MWSGEVEVSSVHPVGFSGSVTEIASGVAFVPSFANVSAFATEAGLVFVDTGSSIFATKIHAEIRKWSQDLLHTAIYSHGHIDHVFGVATFEREAEERGWPKPVVVAHEGVPRRFDRYVRTAGYNAVINQRQFGLAQLEWPVKYRYPDRTYSDRLDVEIGGVAFELHHANGETDDHTWTWVPERRVLCCGDLFIWASPNAGNPQKVQRYPSEWAAALRRMASLDAEFLLPGHGFPVVGRERVRLALTETAEMLESLVAQTLELMNSGATLDEVIHSVTSPAHLLDRPYLAPVYDEPEFVVRNIWRLYGGWYDGDPSSLKPAPRASLAAEIAGLVGGAAVLARRAKALAGSGASDASDAAGDDGGFTNELRLAGHLAELALLADPDDPAVRLAHSEVFEIMAATATSTMARGIYSSAASHTSSARPQDSSARPQG